MTNLPLSIFRKGNGVAIETPNICTITSYITAHPSPSNHNSILTIHTKSAITTKRGITFHHKPLTILPHDCTRPSTSSLLTFLHFHSNSLLVTSESDRQIPSFSSFGARAPLLITD
ncbi:unnamed protein product [Sphenostylis stenocarpa]|uniref:Uncharacterized protein n=1 Tax=Sphenostylis stenocarpa TaxID=92480 RepID=A0AA86T1A4_9FABA|nr:unnamed protein product [Sphenostylis stenocarpa]